MTLRKPTYGGGGAQGSVALLYPATSSSPSKPESQSPGIESSSNKATFLPNDDERQDQRQDVQSPRRLSSKGLTADQSPRIFEENGGELDSQIKPHSNILPPSLHIPLPLVTPSSSLESHHSIPTESSEILERDLGDRPQGQSRARSSSNNPFLRNLENNPLPTTNLISESSSVNIWADEQTALDANIHSEQHPGAPSPLHEKRGERIY